MGRSLGSCSFNAVSDVWTEDDVPPTVTVVQTVPRQMLPVFAALSRLQDNSCENPAFTLTFSEPVTGVANAADSVTVSQGSFIESITQTDAEGASYNVVLVVRQALNVEGSGAEHLFFRLASRPCRPSLLYN